MTNKLDIVLVHPNASQKIYQDLSKSFSAIEPPIWVAMMATFLEKKGFSVSILDCEALQLTVEESYKKIKSLDPKVIAAVVYGQQPSASSQNMVGATLLMQKLSELDTPRIYVGPHPSALPIRTIQDDPDAFVCKGEGPYTLEKFLTLKNFKDDSDLETVPGLWFRSRKDNSIKGNKSAPLMQNLDEEMPNMAWHLLPLEKYRTSNWHSWTNNFNTQPFMSVYTSLGCPYRCSFCMINTPFDTGDGINKFRHWDPQKLIKTFDKIADLGIKNVKIADEMFVLKKTHFLELCKLLADRGHGFNIWAYARIDTVKDEYLETLKKAGVNWLALGIESANFKIRQEVTKGKFQETNILDIIEKINAHEISVMGNYIFGLPNDTMETMRETLDMAMKLPTDYANFYSAMAYPGSALHKDTAIKNPELLPEYPGNPGWIGYSQHAYETFNLPTAALRNSEILKFRDEAFEQYFSNSNFIQRMTAKFGPKFKNEMDRMLSIKLKRKIIEDDKNLTTTAGI